MTRDLIMYLFAGSAAHVRGLFTHCSARASALVFARVTSVYALMLARHVTSDLTRSIDGSPERTMVALAP
jgi:hypothetical protein